MAYLHERRSRGMAVDPDPHRAARPFEDLEERAEQDRVDPSLGGGRPDAIFDALGHYADAPAPQHFAQSEPPGGATGAPAPAPAPVPGPAPAPAKPSKAAKAAKAKSKPAPPKKQRHDWQKIREATDEPSDPYDIGWIEGIDARVQKSIDGPYADEASEAKVQAAIRNDAKLGKLAANRKATLAVRRSGAPMARRSRART